MKGKCPRCKSSELIFLFKQDRHSSDGKYAYTWQYVECCDCELVFIEQIQSLATEKEEVK